MSDNERIETRELIINDADGKPRIRLGTEDNGTPIIVMFDTSGQARVELRLNTSQSRDDDEIESPEIRLLNEYGEFLVCLGVERTSQPISNAKSSVMEGQIRCEEPFLYLKSGTDKQLSAIDLMVCGGEPMMLVSRANEPRKYSFTIDKEGRPVVKPDPFD